MNGIFLEKINDYVEQFEKVLSTFLAGLMKSFCKMATF